MKQFFWKDKTGRGFSNTLRDTDLILMEDEEDWNDVSLHDYAHEAEVGESWETATTEFIRIK